MADANKNPEVEIDLDDVKETDVKIEETKQEESKDPNLNVGEVDLGYTNHDKEEQKEEVAVEEVEEPTSEDKTYENERETKLEKAGDPDDLSEVSESVKKRIDKLTRRFREAERREEAALKYAKGLQKKYDDTQTKYDSTDEKYLKEFDARVDAQREQVKKKLKDAIENNDAEKIMEANDELTQLSVEKEKARIKMADREARLKQLEEQKNAPKEEEPKQAEPQSEPSDKARKWASDNAWFGNDKIMTNAAMTVHEDLVGMGVDVESDEYYNEIDKRMKDNFPHRFAIKEQRRPVQKVASAGRTQQGRRSVRLTKSQVAIAKKLGVPLEEYAKFVKEV
jgi:chromosome segregation ATPase